MKLFAMAVALFLTASAHAQDKAAPAAPDKNFYVFLCFGQSNMEGFPGIQEQDKTGVDERFQMLAAVDFTPGGRYTGPERKKENWYTATPPLCRQDTGLCPADFFGRTLVANLPKDVRIGVVNVAVAGSKIEIFDKVNYETYLVTAPSYQKNDAKLYGGSPYQRLVDLGKLAQKTGVIKGILLHQGESNSGDKEWPGKVKAVYENLLKDLDLKAADVPLLAGELVGGTQKGMNKNIIATLPQVIPTAHVISSEGCVGRPDNLHFTPEGYRELGKRYAEAMLPLLGVKLPEKLPAEKPAEKAAETKPEAK
jgi:hypothetical protein